MLLEIYTFRCYFHFSPVVVNTVVCCFADCYSYCRYKDVLSNKAINQLMHGKAQGVLQKVPKSVLLSLRLNLMRGERGQVRASFPSCREQAACEARRVRGRSREGFAPPRGVRSSALDLGVGPGRLQPRHLLGLVPPFCLCLSLTLTRDSPYGSRKALEDEGGPSDPKAAFALFLFLFSSAMWKSRSRFPRTKPRCQTVTLGVISEVLTPAVSTSPFPSSGVTEDAPPGAETVTGGRRE